MPSNRAVSFNEQLNVVGIPAREGILSSDDENNNDDNNEAKAYYKKCFRRGEMAMSPETSPKTSFDDDHQPSLGDTMGGGNDDFGCFPVSSGTWSTDMVPEFMISAAAAGLAEYRRVSIDDRSDWSAKAQQQHHMPSSFDASSTQQDLTSTGGRSSQGTSSAAAHSDMRWSHHDSANIVITPSPTKRRGSSNNSSLGGNPLDDDSDTAHHEQQLPTGSSSKVHFLVSEDEREDRLLRLDPISTSPTQETSNPLEYSSPKTVLDVSGPSIDVPDVSGSSWSEEHWCGPVQKVHTLPKMATTAPPPSADILERSDDEGAMDENLCNTSGVVEVPMMCSSSLSPSRLSPRRQ